MAKKPKFDVFISYSHLESDREWVREFARALQERNLSVWFDEEMIAPGEQVAEAINNGLRASKTVAVILSEGASQKPSMLFEMGAAIGMGKRVVPIVPPEVDPTQFPAPLQLRRFLNRRKPEETAAEFIGESAAIA
jgi:fructose-bisphosphate aldolase class 1